MRMTELPISEPCQEDWDAMREDPGARRFCDQCTKHVHDLSELTEAEARAVLDNRGDRRICVRYRVDGDGSLKFKPAEARTNPAGAKTLVPLTALRRRTPPATAPLPRRVVAAVGPMAMAVAMVACTPHTDPEPRPSLTATVVEVVSAPDEHVVMGEPTVVDPPGNTPQTEEPCPETNTDTNAKPAGVESPEEFMLMGDVAALPPQPEIAIKGELQAPTHAKR